MGFLNPLLLAGLLGIAIPVWIHLRQKRRVERIRWGAMRFLKTAVERHERRIRIENRLLLTLRCLAVGLLALALARPIGCGQAAQGRGDVVLLLDVSGSMGVGNGVKTRLDEAREKARDILRSLSPRQSIAVWGVSDGVDPWINEPTRDRNLALKVIEEAARTDRGTQALTGVRQAVAALSKRGHGGEVILITDVARQGLGEESDWRRVMDDARAAGVTTRLLTVGGEQPVNLVITDLRQETGGGHIVALGNTSANSPGKRVRYVATVRNTGISEARGIKVVLEVSRLGDSIPVRDGRVDEARIEVLGPGEAREVSLFARYRQGGEYGVKAEVVSGDSNSNWDNARSTLTEVRGMVRALVVEDSRIRGGAGEGLPDVRETSGFYLRQALDALGYQTSALSYRDLGGARLGEYDLVVLTDLPALGPAEADGLLQYLRAGGGLLAFVGPRTELAREALNRELFQIRGLLPAPLGDARGSLGGQPTTRPFSTLKEGGDFGLPSSGVNVYRLMTLGGLASESRRVLDYTDGSVAVAERVLSGGGGGGSVGRVILVTTTADMSWTDWPVRIGAWIPTMDRLAGSLVGGGRTREVQTGQVWSQRIGQDLAQRELRVIGPMGDPLDVGTGMVGGGVERSRDGSATAVVRVSETGRSGMYRVQLGEQELAFVAQPPASESQTQRITLEEVEKLRALGVGVEGEVPGVASGEGRGAGGGGVAGRGAPSEWGMLALWILLGLVGLESVLAWRFGRAK